MHQKIKEQKCGHSTTLIIFVIINCRNKNDTKETRPSRSQREYGQFNNEESSSPSDVQTKSSPTGTTHSYSKLRGRGRGRGQTQELKKPRKNAADFTREREEARKKEVLEKKKQAEQQHFEGEWKPGNLTKEKQSFFMCHCTNGWCARLIRA